MLPQCPVLASVITGHSTEEQGRTASTAGPLLLLAHKCTLLADYFALEVRASRAENHLQSVTIPSLVCSWDSASVCGHLLQTG